MGDNNIADADCEQRVIERLRVLLVSLPFDLKLLAEAIGDGDLPVAARALAAGGTIYCLTPHDVLHDAHGVLGYVDDVILCRIVLGRFREEAGDAAAQDYASRYPEPFDLLDADLSLFRATFDQTLRWVDRRIERFPEIKYKGKTIADYVAQDDAALRLYEEAQEFLTAYDIDEFAAERLVTLKPVTDAFCKLSQGDSVRRASPAAG